MALILNDIDSDVLGFQPELTSDNGLLIENQLYVDQSTITSEMSDVYTELANHAGAIAKKAKRNKTYDFETRNKSFLDTYQDLRTLGVKNNKFHLVLYDRDLIGVDPHGPVIPLDLQVKIYIEIMINPYYYIREVLRIPTTGLPIEPGGGMPYKLDRNNLACWYLWLNAIDHYQSKPRQQGKTQDAIAKFGYAYNFGNISSKTQFFNKDQAQANYNLYLLKCQRDMLPTYLQMKYLVNSEGKIDKGIDNAKSIKNPVTNNVIVTMGKATSKGSAMRLGRGDTAPLQHMDEFDFIPWQTEIINTAAFAFNTAKASALKNGSLAGRIFTSTPGDLDNIDGQNATEFISKMLPWKEEYFDKPIEQLKKIVEGRSYNRFVFVEHSWQQLKLSIDWYEEQCSSVSYNMEVILREIELKRIHGSNQSPFSREALMFITRNQKEVLNKIDYSKNLCYINIYAPIYKAKPYILGIDPSEGLGSDNNAFVLIDPVTEKALVEFESPYITQPELCNMVIRFLDEYCPNTMIVIENNRGREAINYFLKSKYRDRLYFDDKKMNAPIVDNLDKMGRLKTDAMQRRAYGLTTTGTSRSDYFGILERVMEEDKEIIYTPSIVRDITGLIRKPTGRIEHGATSHDDVLFAYLMCLYVLNRETYEKLEQYGIYRGDSTDYSSFSDSGEMSEETAMTKMFGMINSLPQEFRDLLKGVVNPNAIAESRKGKTSVEYMRESLVQEDNRGDMNRYSSVDEDMPTNPVATNQFTSDQDINSFWESFDNRDSYDSGMDFNIEDYID